MSVECVQIKFDSSIRDKKVDSIGFDRIQSGETGELDLCQSTQRHKHLSSTAVATMRRKSVIAIKSPNTLNQTHRGRRRREERGVNISLEQPARVVVEVKVLEFAEIGDRRRRTEGRATHAGAGNGAARGKNWWRAAAQNNKL